MVLGLWFGSAAYSADSLKVPPMRVLWLATVLACGLLGCRAEGDHGKRSSAERHPVGVEPVCSVSTIENTQPLGVHVLIVEPLVGVAQDSGGSGAAKRGRNTPLRVLLDLECNALFPPGQPLNIEAAERWYHQTYSNADYGRVANHCQATTIDLAALDAGQPFSAKLFPRVHNWQIRRLSPALSEIDIGDLYGDGQGGVSVVGVSPAWRAATCKGCGAVHEHATVAAHISWDDFVDVDGGALLTASCPGPEVNRAGLPDGSQP